METTTLCERTLSYVPIHASVVRSTMSQLEAGTKAPEFTLPDQDGTPVSLADFKGQRVLLYFYPADDTPRAAPAKPASSTTTWPASRPPVCRSSASPATTPKAISASATSTGFSSRC
jgi:hypothetical protein